MNSNILISVIALLLVHAYAHDWGYTSIHDIVKPSNNYTSAEQLVNNTVYDENTTYSKFYTSAALAYCDKTGHLNDPADCCSASSWLDYIGFKEMYLSKVNTKAAEELTYTISSNAYDTNTRPFRHFLVSFGVDKTKGKDAKEIERTFINYELVDYDVCNVDVIEGTKVVRYFDRLYKAVRGQLFEDLESIVPHRAQNFDITFIGHSLGGALAELAAFEFKSRYPDHHPDLVTFGSPRVGNFKFSSQLALK